MKTRKRLPGPSNPETGIYETIRLIRRLSEKDGNTILLDLAPDGSASLRDMKGYILNEFDTVNELLNYLKEKAA